MLARHRCGFTLIELSIVLVIIGLLAAGVLVGRYLIHAAELRRVVRDVGRFDTAINTFREKYGGLPGDLQQDKAVAAGLTTATGGYPDIGNGNGALTDANVGATPHNIVIEVDGEGALLWRQLSEANLIGARIDGPLDDAARPVTYPATAEEVRRFLPPAPMNQGSYMVFTVPGPLNGPSWNTAIELTYVASFAPGNSTMTGGLLPPLNAAAIDGKMDDGDPVHGTVIANDNGQSPPSVVAITTVFTVTVYGSNAEQGCVLGAASSYQYNTSGPWANARLCNLAFVLKNISASDQ